MPSEYDVLLDATASGSAEYDSLLAAANKIPQEIAQAQGQQAIEAAASGSPYDVLVSAARGIGTALDYGKQAAEAVLPPGFLEYGGTSPVLPTNYPEGADVPTADRYANVALNRFNALERGVLTPNMATVGAIGGVIPQAAKVLEGYFLQDMARHAPEIVNEFQQAQTGPEYFGAGLDAATTATIGALLGRGLLRGQPEGKVKSVEEIQKEKVQQVGQGPEVLTPAVPEVQPSAPLTYQPFADLQTGEPTNAQQISTATSLPQREVRPQVGESSSLREQGQTPEAGAILTPPQEVANEPRPAGPTAPGETPGRSERVGAAPERTPPEAVAGEQPGPVGAAVNAAPPSKAVAKWTGATLKLRPRTEGGSIGSGGGRRGAQSEQSAKLSKALEDEIENKIQTHEESRDPSDPEDGLMSRGEAIHQLLNDADYPESYASNFKRELQDYGARIGIFKPFTKAQLDVIYSTGGKKYDFKRGDIYYRFESWKPLEGETPTELTAGVAIPKFTLRKVRGLDDATMNRSATLQESTRETMLARKELRKAVPSKAKREAIAVYREAGGDMATLAQWEAAAKSKWMRRTARDAQRLTAKEIKAAGDVGSAYDTMEQRGNAAGVLNNHRDNYVTHVWKVDNPGKGFGTRTLKQKFAFNKARTFDTFFEGDQAGFTPRTMDVADLVPGYIAEMNRVIADRAFVDSIVGTKDSNGNPNVIPRGRVQTVVDPDGNPTFLSRPNAQNLAFDSAGKPVDQSEYRVYQGQPALSRWAWKAQDSNGNAIMQQGDLALSKEAYKRVHAMMGESGIRKAYRNAEGAAKVPAAIMRGLDVSQSALKREMFGLLPAFHMVQEGWHAIGHRVNPFFGLNKIEDSPALRDAMKYTMILSDKTSGRQYFEGVGANQTLITQAMRKFGRKGGEAVADVIDGYQHWTFESYIPRLKFTTYEHILDRNLKLYEKDIASGKATVEDIKLLSGQQTDAAYGHLNYAMLDRNPTFQHILQLGLLAPDFLEARGKFVAQAGKSISSKQGVEQLKAIAVLAAVQATGAFTMAQLTGGEWDGKHPFEFTRKGRRYTLRSVPEDLMRAITDTRAFVSGRINPTLQTGIQSLEGLNYRGEKVSFMDTMEEYLAKYIPITARSLPGVRELTESTRQSPINPLEQFAASAGLKVSRFSSITETYKKAADWMDSQKKARDKGSYPVSKYQQLRYALEDGDISRAQEELDKLKAAEPESAKIGRGFVESVTHPFTDTRANDLKFRASLSEDDRKLFDNAIEVRKGLLNKFGQLRLR